MPDDFILQVNWVTGLSVPLTHFKLQLFTLFCCYRMIKRFQSWLSQADSSDTDKCEADSSSVEHSDVCGVSSTTQTQVCKVPEFPLFPLSKGFLICLERSTESLRKVLEGIKD